MVLRKIIRTIIANQCKKKTSDGQDFDMAKNVKRKAKNIDPDTQPCLRDILKALHEEGTSNWLKKEKYGMVRSVRLFNCRSLQDFFVMPVIFLLHQVLLPDKTTSNQ